MKLTIRTPWRPRPAKVAISTGLAGLAAGSALTFFLDPARGARRRAVARQKLIHLKKETAIAASVTARDLAHHVRGIAAETRSHLSRARGRLLGKLEDDAIIVERVRSELGRTCSHPSAIAVSCRRGRVELAGPILEAESAAVLRDVAKVRGVRAIINHLRRHSTGKHVPALQGGSARRKKRPELLQENWSPSARLVTSALGLGLVGYSMGMPARWRVGSALTGLVLFLRGASNLPLKRITGIGAGRRAVSIQKDIHVEARPEEVFAFFRRFENFPRFMSHVRDVIPRGEGRWRWSVTGPAGTPVSWEAELTELTTNQVIAWKSIPGSLIRNAGIVRFTPDRGGTRVSIRLSYNPPGGALGHALVAALGAHPKKQLDDDMVRFKSLLEVGKATGRRETVTKEELTSR